MRAQADIETMPTIREQIIVTAIPYMVNKAVLIEKTAQLVNEKKIEGIADIRDETGCVSYLAVKGGQNGTPRKLWETTPGGSCNAHSGAQHC